MWLRGNGQDSRRPLRWIVAAAAILLACSRGEERYEYVARLGPRGVSETLGDETRPSLQSFRSTTLLLERGIEIPEDRTVELSIQVPRALRDAGKLLVAPYSRTRQWNPLPASVLSVDPEGRVRVVVTPHASADSLELWVKAFVPPPSPIAVETTRAVEIPRGAALEIGMGVLEAARDQGPVQFRVEVCRDDECTHLAGFELDPRSETRWRDERISLADFAGEEVAFRFETRVATPGNVSLPVWSAPAVVRRVPKRSDTPNLILISLDTLRADHTTSYGYARDTTPFIDRALAQRGTVFETVVSSIPLTSPSHMTMFTSQLPSVQSEVTRRGLGRVLSSDIPTLAEVLRDHGFATGAVTENGALVRTRGFDRGFDAYRENHTEKTSGPRKPMDTSVDRALDWLRHHRDRRFFLFLHTYQPHNPYLPSAEYRELFVDDGVPVSPDITPRWQPALYDREIRGADDRLRGFFDALEALGILEETLVVLTSDHGEAFLEHGYLAHGGDLHEEVLRVPLILRGPGIPAGRRIPVPVGLVDLMPTLLDLAGAPHPNALMGRSLVPLLSQPPDASWNERPLFSETWSPKALRADGPETLTPPFFSVRMGTRKLIRKRRGGEYRYYYYQLDRDPGEQHNRYPESAAEAQDLRALLDGYEEMTEALRAKRQTGPAGEPDIDDDTLRMLRNLGYIE